MTDPPEPDLLPCGCFIDYRYEDGVPAAVVSPCNTACPNYRRFLDIATEQGKPITYKEK